MVRLNEFDCCMVYRQRVWGYTDIGVSDGWTSVDCPGWSGYTRTQLPGHPRNVICVQDMVA